MVMLHEIPMGGRLPNGAEVISYRCDTGQNHLPGVVLAKWQKWHRDEYITWATLHGQPDSTHTGHYFRNYFDAYEDYQKRLGKL